MAGREDSCCLVAVSELASVEPREHVEPNAINDSGRQNLCERRFQPGWIARRESVRPRVAVVDEPRNGGTDSNRSRKYAGEVVGTAAR